MAEWKLQPTDIPETQPPSPDDEYRGPLDYEIPDDAITTDATGEGAEADPAATDREAELVEEVAVVPPPDWEGGQGDREQAKTTPPPRTSTNPWFDTEPVPAHSKPEVAADDQVPSEPQEERTLVGVAVEMVATAIDTALGAKPDTDTADTKADVPKPAAEDAKTQAAETAATQREQQAAEAAARQQAPDITPDQVPPEPPKTETQPDPAPPVTPEARPTADVHTKPTSDTPPAPETTEAESTLGQRYEVVDPNAAAQTDAGARPEATTDTTSVDQASGTEVTSEAGGHSDYVGATATASVVGSPEAGDSAVSGEVIGAPASGTEASQQADAAADAPLETMTSFVGGAFADVQSAAGEAPSGNPSMGADGGFVPQAGNPTQNYPDGLPSPGGGVPMPDRPDLESIRGGSPLGGEATGDDEGGGGSEAYTGPALHENPDRGARAAHTQQRQQEQQAASATQPVAQPATNLGNAIYKVRPQSTAAKVTKAVAGAVGRGLVKGAAVAATVAFTGAVGAVGMPFTRIGKDAVKEIGPGVYRITVMSNGKPTSVTVHAPNEFLAKIAARFKAPIASH